MDKPLSDRLHDPRPAPRADAAAPQTIAPPPITQAQRDAARVQTPAAPRDGAAEASRRQQLATRAPRATL